jgi:hypothetical protein
VEFISWFLMFQEESLSRVKSLFATKVYFLSPFL